MKVGDLVKVRYDKHYVIDESDTSMSGMYGLFVRYYGKGIYETNDYCLVYFGIVGIKLINKAWLEIINE